jgi:hypothetical protein
LVCRPSATGELPLELDSHLDVELGAQIRSRIGGDDRPRVVGTSLMSGVWRGRLGRSWFWPI